MPKLQVHDDSSYNASVQNELFASMGWLLLKVLHVQAATVTDLACEQVEHFAPLSRNLVLLPRCVSEQGVLPHAG